jgi:hypothetical protein
MIPVWKQLEPGTKSNPCYLTKPVQNERRKPVCTFSGLYWLSDRLSHSDLSLAYALEVQNFELGSGGIHLLFALRRVSRYATPSVVDEFLVLRIRSTSIRLIVSEVDTQIILRCKL